MAKIICPNKQYCGESASVTFLNGVGETDKSHLINWFKAHGYIVEEDASNVPLKEPSLFDEMSVEQLKAYAKEKGIDIGNSSSEKGIIKKIQDAEKLLLPKEPDGIENSNKEDEEQ